MIQIKNKYYNNKGKKARDKIDKKYLKKQYKRLSEAEKKPLTPHEKYLFGENTILFECCKNSNGFYRFNRVSHIITQIPKERIQQFYNASVKIVIDNPANSLINPPFDERKKQTILNIGEKASSVGWYNICETSPKIEQVKKINIQAFDISIAYLGVCFDVIWEESFIDELNNMIVSQEKKRDKFKQIIVNGKKIITKGGNNPDDIRRRMVDEVLLEYKLRVYDFLRKYYDLEDCYKYMPLSLDEYITNKSLDDRFLMSHGYYNSLKATEFTINVTKVDFNDMKVTCYFDVFEKSLFESDYRINRSRLLLKSDLAQNIYTSFDDLLPLYITMIKKYKLLEYDYLLTRKQKIVNKSCSRFPTIIFKGYREYLAITQRTQVISSILGDTMCKELKSLSDTKMTYYDEQIESIYLSYSKRENEMDKMINEIMNLRNNRFALYISIISLAIAIIAIIINCS